MSGRMFFKVYQDKESVDALFYVTTIKAIMESFPFWLEALQDGTIDLFPVIEPIMMTEEEFESQPEFKGY